MLRSELFFFFFAFRSLSITVDCCYSTVSQSIIHNIDNLAEIWFLFYPLKFDLYTSLHDISFWVNLSYHMRYIYQIWNKEGIKGRHQLFKC